MTFVFLSTIAPGFFLAKLLSGKGTGQPAKFGSLRFKIKDYTVHIHHWFWAVVLMGLLYVIQFKLNLAYAFLSGVTIQGLTYSDFYKIVYKNRSNPN